MSYRVRYKMEHDELFPVGRNFAAGVISWLVSDLGLRRNAFLYLQGLTTELDDQGEPLPNTAHPGDYGHDGDAHDNGNIRIFISPKLRFPYLWTINPACKGQYLNNIFVFENAEDMFVFYAAHELRHLWQWENPLKIRQIRRLLKCDDECDSDLYAARKLSEYRSQ